MDSDNSQVVNYSSKGKCSGCGACCADFLPMLPNEVKRIKAYVRKHGIKEQRHTVPSAGFDVTCPFRDARNSKCLIYPVRPAICRSFSCENDSAYSLRVRDEFHRKGTIVAMRYEFFGNREDTEFLSMVLKSETFKNRRMNVYE